jgi:hypothetical protein
VLSVIVEELRRRRLPAYRGGADPMQAAWAAADDPREMIALLEVGAQLQLYAIHGGISMTSAGGTTTWRFGLRDPGGHHLRIEASSADGIRALLPRIAPLAAWGDAVELVRTRIDDPVAQLVFDLERMGRIDPRWAAAWTPGDAWRACTSGVWMGKLLEMVGREDLQREAKAALARVVPPARPDFADPGGEERFEAFMLEFARWEADTIRSAIPDPPAIPASMQADDAVPTRLLRGVSWSFGEGPSGDDFADALLASQDDPTRGGALHAVALAAPAVRVIFEPWDPERGDHVPTAVTIAAPNAASFTGLEIMRGLDDALADALRRTGRRLGDRHFFEGLEGGHRDEAGTATYWLTLGS